MNNLIHDNITHDNITHDNISAKSRSVINQNFNLISRKYFVIQSFNLKNPKLINKNYNSGPNFTKLFRGKYRVKGIS